MTGTVHRRSSLSTGLMTAAALTGFAANSLLCRAALGAHLIDPSAFTLVRLVTGALMLALLVRLIGKHDGSAEGSWRAAFALFVYAGAFSYAYIRLTTGTGALLLFGVVQATMIGWSVRRGERMRPVAWAGLIMAVAGLVTLTLPGLTAPDPLAGSLMALAGVSWGIYSLLGRGTVRPIEATARNFLRAVPFGLALSLVTFVHLHMSARGLLLAAASGALASGAGYSLWYAALRDLPASTAAVAQLLVPLLAALGGILLLGEQVTARLIVAGALITAGVALALAVAQRRRA